MSSSSIPISIEDVSSQISKGKTKILILLESKEQVIDCLTWIDELKDEIIIIALSPSAMYELGRNGLSYKIPEEYYDAEELYEVGLNNFEIVEKMCKIIDTEIQHQGPEFKYLGIEPAMFSFYSAKIVYDAITIRIFQLSKISTIEKPSVIYVYDSLKYPFGAYDSAPYVRFDQRESLYSQILTLRNWKFSVKMLKNPVQCEDLNCESTTHTVSSNVKTKSKVWLTEHPLFYDLALNLQKKGSIGSIYWFKQSLFQKKGSAVLLYGAGYNWDDIYDNLIVEGIHPIFRTLDNFDWLNRANDLDLASLNEAWFKLDANSDLKHFFVFNDVDFSIILKNRFEYLVKRMSLACLIAARETMSFIEKKGIKAVIASTLSTCVGHSVAQAAHNCKIPVVTWQHGGYGMTKFHPLIGYCDFINSDFHFVFGDGVNIFHHIDAEKYGTKIVSVGSSSLELMVSRSTDMKVNTKEQSIIYITSAYMGNELNISTYPPISDTLFWSTQKSIVDILGKHPEKSITIKLHPSTTGTHILESYVLDKGYHNFKFIRREKSFSELLQMSDVVIIDLPFTTILQALMTKKPVFVYTGHVHYNEDAHSLLSKRAICLQDLNGYLSELDKYLDNGVYKADLNDTEFIERYGFSFKNGSVRKRAGQELKTIIEHFIHSEISTIK